MTVIGKIMVFLNLVFSLVLGALVVANYTVRVRWADAATKAKRANDVLTASNQVYKNQVDKLLREKEEHNKRVAALAGKNVEIKDPDTADRLVVKALTDAQAEVKALRGERQALQDARARAEKLATERGMEAKVAKADVDRRQADVTGMRNALDEEIKKVAELTKQKNDLRDDAVAARIEAQSFKDRSEQLAFQVERLQDQVQEIVKRAPGIGGPGPRAPTTAPADLEGTVLRTDTAAGLVTISQGSDNGVQKGQVLQVFRLKPSASYIGTIKVVEVLNKQAVGSASPGMVAKMKKGDVVASNIMKRP